MKRGVRGQLTHFITIGFILILLCGIAAALWTELSASEKLLLRNILDEHPALILTAAFLLPCAVVVAVNHLFRHYIEPLGKLVDDVHVMNLVNPSHRLALAGPAQIRLLAAAINRALERIQDLQVNVADEVRTARQRVEEEKAVLEALLHDLPDGVLVCNAAGQIILYNKRARALLGARGQPHDTEGAVPSVGLGRSVFAFIDRDLIVHAVEMIDRGLKGGQDGSISHFVTKSPGADLLHVEVTQVRAGSPALHGFVLLLRDISVQMTRDSRREALLERIHSSLDTIRIGVEILANHPSMEPGQRERLTRVIRDESFSLSGYLESHRAEHAEFFGSQWPLEEMLARDVAAAVRATAAQSLDVTMTLHPSPGQIFLRVDSFTIVQALVFVIASIKSASGGIEFGIRPLCAGAFVFLDILWRGKPFPAATLREWEKSRIRIAGQELPVTLAGVLRRHDAVLSSGGDPGGTHAYVRLEFHSSEAADDRGTWQRSGTLKSRPEFYDFDLFALPAGSLPLRERALTEISFTAFDTETTGLRPSEGDEVVSIGAVRIVNGRMLREETFDTLIDPGRPIPRESTEVHGIDDTTVQGQPDISRVLAAFIRFAHESVLVGHNAAFDMKFFQVKEEPTGVKLRMPVLDTMLLSAVVHPHYGDHSIEGIAARLGVNIAGRHTALGDAIVTGELFLKLVPLLGEKGIRTLGEAVAASKRTYLARVKY